jgi:hypothetical protein
MTRSYESLRRNGKPEEALDIRKTARDYMPECPCSRCQCKANYYRKHYQENKAANAAYQREWRKRKGAKTRIFRGTPITTIELDRLDMIAMRDPLVAAGRPAHRA